MKKILINLSGHGEGKLFNPNARDNCLDPFIYLRDRLKAIGYDLMTADNHSVEDCAWVWFWNTTGLDISSSGLLTFARKLKRAMIGTKQAAGVRNLYQDSVRAGLRDRMVLFTGEPAATLQQNWDTRAHRMFPVIFTWNDRYVDGKKFYKFHYPLAGQFPDIEDIPFNCRKLLVNISGNKFSTHPWELYSARRQTIRYFEHHHPDDFDLYGVGWDEDRNSQGLYPSYRGTLRNKWDVYPQYRFGVCYENMQGEPGNVTEKIFDCMRAGVVPIYFGAPNITDFVDEQTFIDRQRFESEADLADFLFSTTKNNFMHYREAIQQYLKSEKFAKFLPPAFADNIINILSL